MLVGAYSSGHAVYMKVIHSTPHFPYFILRFVFYYSYSVFCILLLQAAPVVHMVAKVSFDRQSKQVPLHF